MLAIRARASARHPVGCIASRGDLVPRRARAEQPVISGRDLAVFVIALLAGTGLRLWLMSLVSWW